MKKIRADRIMKQQPKNALFIRFCSFSFSKRIVSKYFIFRKSSNLPILIFLRLFGTGMNKITNINRIESINNYFRLQHSFYLRMISQLNQTLSNYPLLPAKISNYVMPNLLLGKVQGGKGIALSAKKVSTAEIASLLLTMTGREAEKWGVDGLFGWQNKNILRAKITDKYLQFAEMKINTRKANTSTLKKYTDLSPDMVYPVRGYIYQDSRAIEQEKTFIKYGAGSTEIQKPLNLLDSRSLLKTCWDKFHGNDGLEYFQIKSGNSFPNVIARSGTPKQSNLSVRLPIFWRAMTGAMHRFIKIAEGCNTLFVKENENNTLNLLQGKVQGGKGIAQSAKKVSTAEIASLLLTMTGREAEKWGVDGLFGWQNKNILRAKITDKYLQFAEMKINTRKANTSTLKKYTDLSPDMVYPVRGYIYQDPRAIEQEKTLSGLKNSINNINNKTTELILRKPLAQSSNIASEIKESLQRERATSIKIHDSVIKDSSKTNPIHEINIIADNVYKIIEKRISIERERRGAF